MSKRKDKRARRQNRAYEKPRFCDPGMCSECNYLGDGYAICNKYHKPVLIDWQPTENTLMCRRSKK